MIQANLFIFVSTYWFSTCLSIFLDEIPSRLNVNPSRLNVNNPKFSIRQMIEIAKLVDIKDPSTKESQKQQLTFIHANTQVDRDIRLCNFSNRTNKICCERLVLNSSTKKIEELVRDSKRFIMKEIKALKRNKNTTKFMLRTFFMKCRQLKFKEIEDEKIRNKFINKVKRYTRKWKLFKETDELELCLKDYKQFFKQQVNEEMSSYCRQAFSHLLLQQSRKIPLNDRIEAKREYMITMKVQAIRSRNYQLMSRIQIH